MSVKKLSDLHFYPNCRTDSKMVPECLFYSSAKCFVSNTAKKHNPGYWLFLNKIVYIQVE